MIWRAQKTTRRIITVIDLARCVSTNVQTYRYTARACAYNATANKRMYKHNSQVYT